MGLFRSRKKNTHSENARTHVSFAVFHNLCFYFNLSKKIKPKLLLEIFMGKSKHREGKLGKFSKMILRIFPKKKKDWKSARSQTKIHVPVVTIKLPLFPTNHQTALQNLLKFLFPAILAGV